MWCSKGGNRKGLTEICEGFSSVFGKILSRACARQDSMGPGRKLLLKVSELTGNCRGRVVPGDIGVLESWSERPCQDFQTCN